MEICSTDLLPLNGGHENLEDLVLFRVIYLCGRPRSDLPFRRRIACLGEIGDHVCKDLGHVLVLIRERPDLEVAAISSGEDKRVIEAMKRLEFTI